MIKVYLVGGAVRDTLLGLEPKDRDYCVVGSSPEEMLSLGFKEVGKDFPVFLHPVTGDEYALARTERKVGIGYKGFECSWEGVTLEEDLYRRDLTINSIAIEVNPENVLETIGDHIDPCNGMYDIENKILRPTSIHFMEDPVRLLRAARFLARYKDFSPDVSLITKGIDMEHSGELDNLVPDRVWKELEKTLHEPHPERFFEFLIEFNIPFMEIFSYMKATVEGNLWHQEDNVFVHTMMVLKHANETWCDHEINFACLMHDVAKPICYSERGNGHGHDNEGISLIEDWCTTYKVPNNYRDLAKIVCEQHQKIHSILGRGTNRGAKPKSIMKIFEQTSALTKPERFNKLLKACESDSKGRISVNVTEDYAQAEYLLKCLEAVLSLDTKTISKEMLAKGKKGVMIGEEIRVQRINKIRGVQNKWEHQN